MRILALDVGKGTQDLLLYDTNVVIENSPKMVMPSQTTIVAKRVRAATAFGRCIFLYGETMGGGPCGGAIKAHLGLGYSVFATPLAAKTLNDDLNKVSSWGVQITDTRPRESCVQIETKDVDVRGLRSALKQFDVNLPTVCAVACQDHGESYGSNRIFRFQHLSDLIEKGGELTRFAYLDGKIPDYLTRLRAVYRTLKKEKMEEVLLMDTGPAAIFGALYDGAVAKRAYEPHIIVNVGNGHTLAAMLHEKRVVGMFEHHTGMLNTDKLDYLLSLFMDGNLTQEWVFEDGGHGCYINQAGFSEINHAFKERGFHVTVIGPLREMMKNSKLNPYFAVPGGDMMLAGCFGLITGLMD
ncbi:MAG: DUF1786 domain-containing protein [Euryarchaeota archaeon]|nr:DUF1786 domain-containing protein [Euryarchaeota archaeon]